MVQPTFRKLSESDRAEWSELWLGYLEFYRHDLTDEQTEQTWQRFFDQNFNLWAFVAELDGALVGLAHCSFTNSTWNETPDLYLEDLFVDPAHRRLGLGEFLIEGCAGFARQSGARKLYWQTHKGNEIAQRVYRKVATKSEFVIFEKKL